MFHVTYKFKEELEIIKYMKVFLYVVLTNPASIYDNLQNTLYINNHQQHRNIFFELCRPSLDPSSFLDIEHETKNNEK